MNKYFITCTAMLLAAFAHGVGAADIAVKGPASAVSKESVTDDHGGTARHALTLDEARKHAHDYSDKLDKMTPQEWGAMQKERHEFLKKWAGMSPKERAAYLKERSAKQHPQKN